MTMILAHSPRPFHLFLVKTGQNQSKSVKNLSLLHFALSQHSLYRQKQLFLHIGS